MAIVYVLEHDSGTGFYNKAFTDLDLARSVQDDLAVYAGRSYVVKKVELPFVGRHIYYVRGYYGFSYDFSCSKIYDVVKIGGFYPYMASAKTDKLWLDAWDIVSSGPLHNYVTNGRMLATFDRFSNEPFMFGDVADGNFNVAIHKIRVNKSGSD